MHVIVRDLRRRYADGPYIAYGNFRGGAAGGDLIALTGANGSGKSTLLRILATVLRPQGGDALFDGVSLVNNAKTLRRRIGWSGSGDGGLFPHDTALANLRLFAALLGKERCAVDDAISFCDGALQLKDLLEKRAGTLSSGQRARVTLCRTLMGFPPLLLLDEPTRSMDGEFSKKTWMLLREYGRTHTVIAATHDEQGIAKATVRWGLTQPPYPRSLELSP